MTACDFCAAPAAVRYPAAPTTSTATVTEAHTGQRVSISSTFMDAAWHACETCRALITSGRRGDLAARAVAVFFATCPNLADGLTARQAERLRRDLAAS